MPNATHFSWGNRGTVYRGTDKNDAPLSCGLDPPTPKATAWQAPTLPSVAALKGARASCPPEQGPAYAKASAYVNTSPADKTAGRQIRPPFSKRIRKLEGEAEASRCLS